MNVPTSYSRTPEVNLKEHTSHTPLPSVNKAALSGFETQRRRHQKSKTGVSVLPEKNMCPPKIFKKTKEYLNVFGKKIPGNSQFLR